MWVRTTWVHIQNDTWYDVCILILLNICMQRGSKCEHSQGHKQVWECTARVDIPTYLWWNISILVTYVCMQRGSKCEHGQGHRHMWVRTTWAHIQMNLWCDLCSLVSTCMYAKRFSVWALARAQTSVRVHSTGWYTNVSVIWFLIYVYLWVYVCIQWRSRCEHSQGCKHMSACTTWVHIQKYLWWNICILVSTCMYAKRF